MKVRRETVAEQAIAVLRHRILSRALKPDTPVTEEALAREVGVSRPTIREVLGTLVAEGLLTRNPHNRLLRVTQVSAEKAQEIYRVRKLLEIGGVEAAAHLSDDAFQPLEKATAELVEAAGRGDATEIVITDIECHVATVDLLGSSDLTRFFAGLLAKLQLAMAEVAHSDVHDLQGLCTDHQVFLRLILDKRTNEASAHLKYRLESAEKQLMATLS